MSGLLDLETLLRRIEIHVEEETRAKRLLRGSFAVLREAVIAGELERSKIPSLTGYEERGARNVTAALISRGMLKASSHRAPLRLAFPAEVRSAGSRTCILPTGITIMMVITVELTRRFAPLCKSGSQTELVAAGRAPAPLGRGTAAATASTRADRAVKSRCRTSVSSFSGIGSVHSPPRCRCRFGTGTRLLTEPLTGFH